MTEAKNDWIGTEAGRKRFFGKVKKLGLLTAEARAAFGVKSTKEIKMDLDDALDFLTNWAEMRDEVEAETPPEESAEIPAETAPSEVAVIAEKPDITATEWAGRQDIDVLGSRIKAMLPGGDKLSVGQARALAQYSLVMGANPFRGEVYAYEDRSGFHIVEGYKLLVRWAMRQSKYSETYEPLSNLEEGDIGFRCRILRDDRAHLLKEFTDVGADWKEAYKMVAVYADGVVTLSDRTTKAGKAMDPPRGWTWEQVARKRALKNALNLSHGAPSLKEIAEETWMAELSVHGNQSPELTATFIAEGEAMERDHPELLKGSGGKEGYL